jgi:hypothetical protein
MKTLILLLFNVLIITLVSAQPKNLITYDVQFLHQLINKARENPSMYGLMYDLEAERLDTLDQVAPLLLNYKLCQKAHSYAEYLSKQVYNDKLNIVHSTMGYNESIAINSVLYKTISSLIEDKNSIHKGHRFHLLGVNNKDTKIGIGISYVKSLQWYIVVIVTE